MTFARMSTALQRALMLAIVPMCILHAQVATDERPRARDLGIAPGILQPGPENAITDVEGVLVGQKTLAEGDTIRTGVTAILPHPGNLYADKVPAAIAVANGYGKLAGVTQVRELGEIESPILLTNTLSVPEATAGAIVWTLRQPGNERVVSVNVVVGETNDSGLNDIRARAVRPEHAVQAIESAASGPVAEGSVGAGTGTRAFGYKGGIGTSSRRLPERLGGHTVGVLVQSNFGGTLLVDGSRVGEALGRFYLQRDIDAADADGSIVIVIATDAPLSDRNLERLAKRAFAGLARTGASFTNGSGDYAIAFSTHPDVRRTPQRRGETVSVVDLPNALFSPLSQAVIEATEEAILNSLFRATTMSGYDSRARRPSRIEAIPIEAVCSVVGCEEGAGSPP